MCTNLSSISEKIDKLQPEFLARQSGFIRSKPQKIGAKAFVLSFMQCIGQQGISLSDWAHQLMLLTNISVSKQAIDQRTCKSRHVDFALSLLQASLSRQLSTAKTNRSNIDWLSPFHRILVQDSSCVQLPRCLATSFEGAPSKANRPTASARIQLTADLKNDQVVNIDLNSYRDNDQSYSSAILDVLQANDLVLRDQGYFVLDVFKQIMEANAFFLSRLKPNVNVYKPNAEQAIDLLKYGRSMVKKGQTRFELPVEIGQKHRLPVRLIAELLPKDIYQARVDKARKDRHQKAKHSANYLALLQWQFLITNATPERLPQREAYKMYRLRWRIEIFFKCWKSQFHLQKVMLAQKQLNPNRAKIMIYLYLTYINLVFMKPFMHLARIVYQKTGKLLSITKWARMVAMGIVDYHRILTQKWIEHLARAATYERRTHRKNHLDLMWEHLFA